MCFPVLVVVVYVPVVRWFMENGKNEGTGFKIKPESFTCLKDHVQKEITFLGTKGTISPFKQNARSLFIHSPLICFPDIAFYKHFLQEKTHFSSLAAQFPAEVSLSEMIITA